MTTPALLITNLNKTYDDGTQAVAGIDLTVEQGDFFALLGPNGAGKSSTIGAITSLVRKTSGGIEVFGHNIDTALNQAKTQIGLVPQEVNFNMFENVELILLNQAGFYGLPKKLAKQRAEKYLKLLELWDKRHATARMLSGGMKRRLMIARALVHEPKLLILDEPTAGVDIEIRRSMWVFLKALNEQGTTIILTTHYLEEAENLCRNVAIIDKGRIVENAPMTEVLDQLSLATYIFDTKQPVADVTFKNFASRARNSHALEVDVENHQTLNQVFTELTQQQIDVKSVRTKANRLEELFLRLVDQKEHHHE